MRLLVRGEFAEVALSEECKADYTIDQLSELFQVLHLIAKGEIPAQKRRSP